MNLIVVNGLRQTLPRRFTLDFQKKCAVGKIFFPRNAGVLFTKSDLKRRHSSRGFFAVYVWVFFRIIHLFIYIFNIGFASIVCFLFVFVNCQ